MERKFDLKLENVESGNISIRFYSKHNLKLAVLRIRAFYQLAESDDYETALVRITLDNNAEIKTFSFPKESNIYTSLNFIIKDKTNKMQYAVQVPLNGEEVKYTQMIFEGV